MEKDVGGGNANFGNVYIDTVFIRVYRLSLGNETPPEFVFFRILFFSRDFLPGAGIFLIPLPHTQQHMFLNRDSGSLRYQLQFPIFITSLK